MLNLIALNRFNLKWRYFFPFFVAAIEVLIVIVAVNFRSKCPEFISFFASTWTFRFFPFSCTMSFEWNFSNTAVPTVVLMKEQKKSATSGVFQWILLLFFMYFAGVMRVVLCKIENHVIFFSVFCTSYRWMHIKV